MRTGKKKKNTLVVVVAGVLSKCTAGWLALSPSLSSPLTRLQVSNLHTR